MSRPLLLAAALVFVLLGLAPIGAMALRVEPGDFAGLLGARTLGLLGRTLLLGAGSCGLAVLLGAPFGFLVARTDVPGAALLRPLGLVPLVLPPLFLAITWTVLSDLRGAPMAIVLMSLGTFPIVAFFTALAAERVDARREEAALLAGGWRAALRVELPLLLPAVLCGACLAFVFAINDFAVPDYVSSVGPKFNVYADEVFANWKLDQHTGRAVVTSLPLVLLTLVVLLPALALRRRGTLATLEGDFLRPAPLRLGRLRWAALAYCLLLVGAAALVPLGRLVYDCGGGAQGWSGARAHAAFARALELSRGDLANSLLCASAAGLVAVPVALVLGHAAERLRLGRWLELVYVLPIAVPAILFGIGEIALWNHDATARLYDGNGLVILLFVGRFLPFPLLLLSGAVATLGPRLEEAAQLAGAGPARRLARIVAPALLPSLLGAWALVFVLSMRELDAAILVPAANHTVIFRVFNQIHFGRDDFVAALALLVVFFLLLPGLAWSLYGKRRVEVLP
ncbi:MAG: iron ABC transporter permease [Planctomycetes bacterium]|nr:iron ABC transporter permease [Planctomycetota bacterium]